MLKFVEDFIKNKDFDVFRLLASVSNFTAINIYKDFGFEQGEIFTNTYCGYFYCFKKCI